MQAKVLILLAFATFALAAPSEKVEENKPKNKRSFVESSYGHGYGEVHATFGAPDHHYHHHGAEFIAPSHGHGHATFASPHVDLVAPAHVVSHGVHTNTIVTKHVPVAVPHPVAVPVEKHIPYPVIQKVAVPVDRPYPVAVPKPYPVEVTRTIHVPVDRPVPVPVHVPVVKHIPAPYPVKVAVPVHVPVHVPVIKHVPIAIHSRPIVIEKYHSNSGWNSW